MTAASILRPSLVMIAVERPDGYLVIASRSLTHAELRAHSMEHGGSFIWDSYFRTEPQVIEFRTRGDDAFYAIGRTVAEALSTILEHWAREDANHPERRPIGTVLALPEGGA